MGKYRELKAKLGKNGNWLTGAVYRITGEPIDHRGRRIVVGIEPGDVLTFREERGRKTFTLSIDSAFRYAVKKEVERQNREKNKGKKPRKFRVKRGRL